MLNEFLMMLARSDHVWSESDCAMTIANWWRLKHGCDPAADLRGTYHSEAECQAVLQREGGMIGVVTTRAAGVHASPTEKPVPEDIGVIHVHGMQFGAVLGPSGRWVVKSPFGIATYRCEPLVAWRT